MAEDEEDLNRLNNFDREGLPNSGSEREIIEYYFHKGFEYKNIVLFLQRYHGIRLSERTLKRRLKDFGLKRRKLVDENVEGRARDIIKEELSAGPDSLNGYRYCQSGILDMTNDIHKEALWFCFADVFQTDLDKAKQHWNSHRIRKSHETTVPGVPDILYFLPEQSGGDRQDCLAQVSLCKLEEVEQQILGGSREEETDEVWEEYFHYVMENNGLTYPTTIFEAGELFQSLVNFATGLTEAN
ncbi:Hypothetical predicted protein [Paramuricea clavata]|uniref:Integrase core domain-containing protein n=1 Tax=Paramuricea clavata TaxID=317549 RepID=A0A6S7I7L4_PARCT|nr:Hypothetical predicted protein [Paramuricea clavata]